MRRKDIFSKKKRSKIMASIRGKNTKIEEILDKALRCSNLSFERHFKITGTPDFAFQKERLAVFCHGDFWHGKNYDRMKPKLNNYWRNKIEMNMKRDSRVKGKLNKMGWYVMTLKGSEINKNLEKCVERVKRQLHKNRVKIGSTKAWRWFCLRYHRKESCAYISRKYKISRQAVNQATIRLAQRVLHSKGGKIKCPICSKSFTMIKDFIKTNKYDTWKKYTLNEMKYIKSQIKFKTAEQIAKKLGRTPRGVAAKIRRVKGFGD